MTLEQDFEKHIIDIHEMLKKEVGYAGTEFKKMLGKHGAFGTAKRLLAGPFIIHSGLTTLALHSKLGYSIEAIAIDPQWRSLFTVNELEAAIERLYSLNYPVYADIHEYIDGVVASEGLPRRRPVTISRRIREPGLSGKIKALYAYECQICKTSLKTANGAYAEAAHIRAIGGPHNGSDTLNNMLCLCPNHHKLLDLYGLYIDQDFIVQPMGIKLNIHDLHVIDRGVIAYHEQCYHSENN